MNKKYSPYIILLLLAVLVFILRQRNKPETTANTRVERNTSAKKERGFSRTISQLEYTKHALCRMDCREISKNDIEGIMKSGKINYAKSDLNDTPCPTYALQGLTDDGQNLRVVFAQCNEKIKVVTAIDLEKEFDCYCPGDEKKKKN